MMSYEDSQQHWDRRYAEGVPEQQPARVLVDYGYLLPPAGRALDLACGLGANALLLARQGLQTWAWDISPVAIDRLQKTLLQTNVSLHAEVRDVLAQPLPVDYFDVIVVSHFLERSLADPLQRALRPGGLLFYQTFTKLQVQAVGPRNPDFVLEDNELLRLFAGLKVRIYREESQLGDVGLGFRNEAMLIAQRV